MCVELLGHARCNVPRLEVLLVLIGLEMHQSGEQQNHVSALIHDRRMAEVAADLAGELVLDRLLSGIIPLQVMMTVSEVDVVLVEDGGPLERSSCRRQLKLASVLRHATNDDIGRTYRAASDK